MLEHLPDARDTRPTLIGRAPAPAAHHRTGVRRRPGQLVALGFAAAIAVGTVVLRLPVASQDGPATWLEALFTATSAVCVTGLVVVDTATHWSGFGQVVILVLIQVGGLGIMTLATLLGLLISRRLGLGSRLVVAAATRTVDLGDVRSVLLGVVRVSLLVESVVAVVLTLRLWLGLGETPGRAAWFGVFHAISAFNNAGFSTRSDSLMGYVADPWVLLPVAGAVVLGGIGFPVLFELRRQHRRPSRWSLHTKITLVATGVLLPLGALFVLAAEWGNPRTLGGLDVPGKLLAGVFESVMTRTAGFNALPTGDMRDGTWLGTDVLMFIGGGSGGTAGGIKVTTFAVLGYVIWSELRGDPDVTTFDRRISPTVQRQALAVALISVAAVVVSTLAIALSSPFTVDRVLFEVVSAFATVGLSTGITADLGPGHQLLLVVLMFVGRLGPITLGTALALRERNRLFRHPEAAPIVG
ncbi:TrkH family potassium uptake protein [Cellulomonas sp. APG4]|uniref:TrkH family potassium uptake protein n=1 Tax=Cellulomonas sp. APG4 TaxID=1538656 RepID=UPI0013793C59|nr:potassium transporter TrkG [Cellulomonas sp. APG4]NCT91423.1 TrkH family potassium uptake protein [Cellulomonas sp. APG4]